MAKHKSYEKMTPKERQLLSIRQSAPRGNMPRPAVFADKSKYNRNREKAKLKKDSDQDNT